MKKQAGLSLPELLFVMAFVAVTALITTASSTVWLQRESARSGAHELLSALQTARIEAVSRNRPCRLVLDPATRAIELFDGEGTSATSDDRPIRRTALPASVSFAGPGPGAPVTLRPIDGGRFEAIFSGDGRVTAGDGRVLLRGGETYYRLSVLAAGGVTLERWNGAEWTR